MGKLPGSTVFCECGRELEWHNEPRDRRLSHHAHKEETDECKHPKPRIRR